MENVSLKHHDMDDESILACIDVGSNYLEHFQVKGAKHGIRRYQNKDGSLTPLGRIHYGVGKARDAVSNKLNERKKEKQRLQEELDKLSPENAKLRKMGLGVLNTHHMKKIERMAEKKKAQEESEKKSEKEEVESIIRSGNEKMVYENRHKLNDQELQSAINRIRLDQQITKLHEENQKTILDRGEKWVKTISRVGDIAGDMVKVYDNVQKVKKVFDDREDAQEAAKKKAKQEKINKAISSGDWKKINQYKGDMTLAQMQDMFRRQNTYDAIKDALDKSGTNDWRKRFNPTYYSTGGWNANGGNKNNNNNNGGGGKK